MNRQKLAAHSNTISHHIQIFQHDITHHHSWSHWPSIEASLAYCCCALFCNHPFSFGFFHTVVITHFLFFSSLLSHKSDWVLNLCTSVPAMRGIIPAGAEDRHASSTTIHNYQFNKTKVLFQDISFLNIFQTHQWMSVGHSAFYSMQVVIYLAQQSTRVASNSDSNSDWTCCHRLVSVVVAFLWRSQKRAALQPLINLSIWKTNFAYKRETVLQKNGGEKMRSHAVESDKSDYAWTKKQSWVNGGERRLTKKQVNCVTKKDRKKKQASVLYCCSCEVSLFDDLENRLKNWASSFQF